jgi:hypothetical protein
MNDTMIRKVIAVAFGVYALYLAVHLPPLIIDNRATLLLVVFGVETVAALIASVGVWRGARWMSAAVVVVGLAYVCRQLVEGPVLGLIAYLPAIGMAALGLLAAGIVAIYLRQPHRLVRS